MRRTGPSTGISKLATGIPGFDFVALGGLPAGRSTLVAGATGCGKTVFSAQFLAGGIEDQGTPGIFVTLEDRPVAIRENTAGFGWDVEEWEERGRWGFVDVSPALDVDELVVGDFDLDALLARIRHAVDELGAERVAIDSVDVLFSRFEDTRRVRRELFRMTRLLDDMGMTSVITAEAPPGGDDVTRHGIEEYVSDNVVVLRNRLSQSVRQRTLEVLKFRGTDHQKGEFPFTIRADVGFVVVPLTGLELEHPSTEERISTGIQGLDEMCGGGLLRTSNVLLSGATGTGKSLAALFTSTTPIRVGQSGGLEADISTTMDTILTIRYAELEGSVQRGILVLKMRGSGHAKELRRLSIDNHGIHIGEPLSGITGILAGIAVRDD